MKKIKSCKGITLLSLVITIIVMIIIASVTVSISVNQFESMRLKAFYSKLEIAQEGVNKIATVDEKYTDTKGNIIVLKEVGTEPTAEQKALIESLGYTSSNFKFITNAQLEQQLEITGVGLDLLIDFSNRIVIAPEGINVGGKMYYMLENNKYTIEKDENKNKGAVDFNYSVKKYAYDTYKITIAPINTGDVKEGIVKYKKQDINYWTAAENNEIVINQLATYEIMYIDANNNQVQKTITISLDDSGNVIATEVKQ